MEKYTVFMDRKNQYSENEYTTQGNLQIQHNPYRAAAPAAAKLHQSCPTLCNPGQPTRLPGPWDSPGKNTGVG